MADGLVALINFVRFRLKPSPHVPELRPRFHLLARSGQFVPY